MAACPVTEIDDTLTAFRTFCFDRRLASMKIPPQSTVSVGPNCGSPAHLSL